MSDRLDLVDERSDLVDSVGRLNARPNHFVTVDGIRLHVEVHLAGIAERWAFLGAREPQLLPDELNLMLDTGTES